jgi:hypothetical protein
MEKTTQRLEITAAWLDLAEGGETAHTSAAVEIEADDLVLTANENRWAHTIRPSIYVSAYPLGLWFAANWWRLRWEPASDGAGSTDWNLSHAMSGANEGFLWPNLRFESTGDHIEIFSRASSAATKEMVRFLVNEHLVVTAPKFERAVDDFVRTVLDRLEAFNFRDTDLHQLWKELQLERADPELSNARKLEAMAGFDAGEMGDALSAFLDLQHTAGKRAAAEIAAACRGANPEAFVNRTVAQARSAQIRARIPALSIAHLPSKRGLPWEEGQTLAQLARRAAAVGDGPVKDAALCDLLSLARSALRATEIPSARHLGLAIRHRESDELRLSFRRANLSARRFEAARFIGETLCANEDENWFPATDSKTDRQRIQRAFAIEFLCPFEELRDRIPGYPTGGDIEEAASHYQVSPLAIASQLVNHGIMSSDRLNDYAVSA